MCKQSRLGDPTGMVSRRGACVRRLARTVVCRGTAINQALQNYPQHNCKGEQFPVHQSPPLNNTKHPDVLYDFRGGCSPRAMVATPWHLGRRWEQPTMSHMWEKEHRTAAIHQPPTTPHRPFHLQTPPSDRMGQRPRGPPSCALPAGISDAINRCSAGKIRHWLPTEPRQRENPRPSSVMPPRR